VALDPSNMDAHGNLGVLLFFQKNYRDAVPELREVLKQRPTLWKIEALLGMAERRSGGGAAALADLEAAFPQLQETKIRVDTGMELIESYSSAGDLEKASAIASTLQTIDPENLRVLYAAYRIHSDLAREAMLRLSVAGPQSAFMYQVMAHELARRGDKVTAIKSYREALKIDPTLPGLHFELAEMLRSMPTTEETSKEAKAEYELALTQNPFDEKANLRLGEIAISGNDLPKAYDFYTQATKLQPDDPDANLGLSNVFAAREQYKEAETLLEHAVHLDPTNPIVHFHLSTIYRKMGRTEDAKHEIQEYKKYKEIRDKLESTYHDMHLDSDLTDVELTK